MSTTKKSILLIAFVLLIDQVLKLWIKTHMTLGQEFSVFGNWFLIHFTENNGMAFGIEFWGKYGKLFLSLFRIVAVIGIGFF
ncbi:MAG TPA: signal peptidase II, partial [Tenuifilaceae bacterium]|nr:signal peptidase II [Tenuifilaceae bacterium]